MRIFTGGAGASSNQGVMCKKVITVIRSVCLQRRGDCEVKRIVDREKAVTIGVEERLPSPSGSGCGFPKLSKETRLNWWSSRSVLAPPITDFTGSVVALWGQP